MTSHTASPAARPHAQRTLLVLALPALSYSLAQTMLVPAFGDLVRELHSDVAAVTWLLTGYLVAAAVFTPLVGRLGDMFGKRRLLVLSVLSTSVLAWVSDVVARRTRHSRSSRTPATVGSQ